MKGRPPKQPSTALSTPEPTDIKRLAVEAVAADSYLVERLVLKGGSAIELLYGIKLRTSADLDFSMEGDFPQSDLPEIEQRLAQALGKIFQSIDYGVFDLHLEPTPETVSPDLASFWGGYRVRFKLVANQIFEKIGDNLEELRKRALAVGPAQRRTFEIDISRFELCQEKEAHSLDGATIFAYSPRLIVAEKLRAICQQMPEYRQSVRSPGGGARARDFFDIYNLIDRFNLVLATPDFFSLLSDVFAAKRVPISLMSRIEATREFHRIDFQSVVETTSGGTALLSYDEYFDKVLSLVNILNTLRNK